MSTEDDTQARFTRVHIGDEIASPEEKLSTAHLLTNVQLAYLKSKAMCEWTQLILRLVDDVELFGGAVRDEILSSFLQKTVVSSDLDFRVSTEHALNKLVAFITKEFGRVPLKSKYPGVHYVVYKVTIPLITNTCMPSAFYVRMDLVWQKKGATYDFDVNSLSYDKTGLLKTSLFKDGRFPLREIIQNIKARKAYVILPKENANYEADNDQYDPLHVLARRAIKLMFKGWVVVVQEPACAKCVTIKDWVNVVQESSYAEYAKCPTKGQCLCGPRDIDIVLYGQKGTVDTKCEQCFIGQFVKDTVLKNKRNMFLWTIPNPRKETKKEG